MHVVNHRIHHRRRMYLPSERMVVNGVGLGDGLAGFKIGKMFRNAIKFTPRSFQLKNILGTIGSGIANIGTFGMASAIAPKTFSAHSKTMKAVGTAAVAVAAVAGGVIAGPALMAALPSMSAGGMLSAGTAVMTGAKALMGGKGGGGPVIDQAYPVAYGSPVPQEQMLYGNNVPVDQQLQPSLFPTMPGVSPGAYTNPLPSGMQLPSPFAPIKDDVLPVGIDPQTGEIIPGPQLAEASMLPNLSGTTWLVIGGVAALGLYMYKSKE